MTDIRNRKIGSKGYKQTCEFCGAASASYFEVCRRKECMKPTKFIAAATKSADDLAAFIEAARVCAEFVQAYGESCDRMLQKNEDACQTVLDYIKAVKK